jgi:DNA polymerase III delta subunit
MQAEQCPLPLAAPQTSKCNCESTALDTHLNKPLAGLYVITSDEHLLALEAADKIRKAARAQGFSEREVLVVDRSFKWGELLAANQSQSLFGDKKLIELRIPTGKPGTRWRTGIAGLFRLAQSLTTSR